ncbi:CoA ester lyase [Azoarcus indigens]|uniref:Citrate lyase subunit beta/citryl-CoA lyase/(S)-citramalyl-CoA lyase n=1 Tax=Azoarcus indigens TaxID=29545 RepID=A0A4R6E621_9RHOO|nr:CoA ester lyase [Azoarcus indigens]NMG68029.1 CoA ester lyase [Azoarcus indigens]TDN53357.1 citrate lyase subunit beta/citryl-CoA lyase/(S)-citramalyl-CoA lyase [Azoarcus indigens]
MQTHATASLAAARSFLFVPASRPERIAKALSSGADVVVVDLEDAVPPADKDAARAHLAAWLAHHPGSALAVRINAAGTPWHEADLVLCRHPDVIGLMLPKAESAASVAAAHEASAATAVLPILETAAGLGAVDAIATAPGCARLVFGKLDLAVELDLVPDEDDAEELVFLPYRAMLALASRRAGLPLPVDGVFTAIGDSAGLARYARRARNHGFGALLLIHPAQVSTTRAAYAPSAAERAWAEAVLSAAASAGGGAVQVEGRMVDAPVIARAERIRAAAG